MMLKKQLTDKHKKQWGGVIISPGCVNSCLFCGNNQRISKAEIKKQEKKIFLNLADLKMQGFKKIEISGSDPIEYADISSLISFMKKSQFDFVKLSTHGRLLAGDDFLKKIALSGLDQIRIPIYGPNADIHDSITKTNGSFNDVVLGIKKLKKLAPKINIQLGFMILKQNKSVLCEMVDLARQLMVDEFYFIIPCIANGDFSYYVPIKDLNKYAQKVYAYCKKNKQSASFIEIPYCVFNLDAENINNKLLPPDLGKFCQPAEKLQSKIKDLPIYRLKKHVAICKLCKMKNSCDGFFVNDVEKYGIGDLRPII